MLSTTKSHQLGCGRSVCAGLYELDDTAIAALYLSSVTCASLSARPIVDIAMSDEAATYSTAKPGPNEHVHISPTALSPTETGKLIQRHPENIVYVQYGIALEPLYLPQMRAMIAKDLSEPYSIYVYRYFLYQWPELCFLAIDSASPERTLVGVVICKLENHRGGPLRGYVAMLATDEIHRGKGIAKTLVSKAIDLMIAKNADEIALETEETNIAAMRLYEGLGFLRSKKLHRYYLNGNSAYRLLLYLKPGVGSIPTDEFWDPYGYGDLPPSAQDDPTFSPNENKDDLFSRGIS